MGSHSLETRLRLHSERVNQLCQVLPLSVAAGFILAIVAVLVLWDHVDHLAASTWLAGHVLIGLLRLAFYGRYLQLRTARFTRLLRLLPWVRVGNLFSGLWWGVAITLLYDRASLVNQLFLVFVLAGVTAGSATSLAPDRRGALLFQASVLLPLALRLAFTDDAIHHGMAAMVLLYSGFQCVSVFRISAQNSQNIELRLQAVRREQVLFASESRFRRLAQRDALTGLPNRYALQSTLPPLLAAAQLSGERLALLYLDLDDFKDINDTRGHGSGDQVLMEVARRLRACLRPEDIIARVGGDEFIVVSRDATSRTQLDQLASRIGSSIAAPYLLDGDPVNLRLSIGIGLFPDDGVELSQLMQHADTALYRAKAQGRNNHQFYDASMTEAIASRTYLERALQQAITAGDIDVEYQPIVSLTTGMVTSLEALARWRHAERGPIPPATFVALAEKCGLIDRLGELVLRKVVAQLVAWRQDKLPAIPVAINVSPRQLAGRRFAELVAEVTGEAGLDPALLQVEITESMLMGSARAQLGALEALRQLGVSVFIDDFGTGYSSLSYLKRLPIDGVKIDCSFVRDMQVDERDATIVSAIVSISHSLGLSVIAEGVETDFQVKRLAALGCDSAQGYHYFKPLVAGQCRELLAQQGERRPASDTLRLRIQRWLEPRELGQRSA